jgi:hypothetical protein
MKNTKNGGEPTKSINVFVILTLLSLSAIPALAVLTDYRQGVMDGLAADLREHISKR